MPSSKSCSFPGAALALSVLVACGDSTGPGARAPLTLSFGAAAPQVSTTASLRVVAGGAPLVVTRVQLVIAEAELETPDASCIAADDDDSECPEIKLGPTLVDLPLDGSIRAVLQANVPAGTYEELEFEIEAVEESDDDDMSAQEVAAFLTANPQFRGVSIRVEGTYDGAPFVYTTDAEAELELEFSPPVSIDGSSNITVHVDVASWFRGPNGVTIDPRTANQGGANKELVDDNIERSFEAFDDDDRDGRDD